MQEKNAAGQSAESQAYPAEAAAKSTIHPGKFRGPQVVIGCCLQIILAIGFCTNYLAGYALLPGTYGIDMTMLGTYVSLTGITGLISCMLASNVIKKIGHRRCIYLSIIVVLAFGLLAGLVPGSLGFAAGMFLLGFLTGFCGAYLTNEIIAAWYVEQRPTMLGITMAALSFGVSGMNIVGGIVFSYLGYQTGVLIMAVAVAILLFLNSVTFLKYLDPSEVGQYPDGSDGPAAAPEMSGSGVAQGGSKSLYREPAFWLFMIISFLPGVYVGYVYIYSTVMFTAGGMDYTLASTMLGLMGILSGLYTLVSGKLFEKMGTRPYLILVFAVAAICNIFAILYVNAPAMPLVIAILVTYMVGYGACMSTTIVVYQVSKPENALSIASKGGAMISIASIVLSPLFGAIVDGSGLTTLFSVTLASCAVGLILYFVLLGYVKKNGQV